MSTYEYRFVLGPMGRDNADHAEVIDTAGIDTWTESCGLLRHSEYATRHGRVSVTADWESAKRSFIQRCSEPSLSDFESAEAIEAAAASLPERQEHIDVPLIVKFSGHGDDGQVRLGRYYAEQFLYDAFLTLNLSAPGCCNQFWGTVWSGTSEQYELRLSGSVFEVAWIDAIRSEWPEIERIPLAQVWKWLSAFRSKAQQVATSRTERALFALLHVCAEPSYYTPATGVAVAFARGAV